MKRCLRTALAAGAASVLALAAAATAAQAETFAFSYTFAGDGGAASAYTITGTFNGTGPVTDITNITNVAASLNGVALNGPLYTWSYTAPGTDCPTCWAAGGAVVSSNPLANNFAFIDAASPPGPYTNYFYIIPWPNGDGNPVATQFFGPGTYSAGNYINLYNGQFAPDNWSVVQIPEFCDLGHGPHRLRGARLRRNPPPPGSRADLRGPLAASLRAKRSNPKIAPAPGRRLDRRVAALLAMTVDPLHDVFRRSVVTAPARSRGPTGSSAARARRRGSGP